MKTAIQNNGFLHGFTDAERVDKDFYYLVPNYTVKQAGDDLRALQERQRLLNIAENIVKKVASPRAPSLAGAKRNWTPNTNVDGHKHQRSLTKAQQDELLQIADKMQKRVHDLEATIRLIRNSSTNHLLLANIEVESSGTEGDNSIATFGGVC